MNQTIEPNLGREQRLEEALLACMEAMESDQASNGASLVERYPEFTAEITEFLACRAEVHRFAEPLRQLAEGHIQESGFADLGIKQESATGEVGRIGDFRLIRKIGSGGMGMVYEAEQFSLRRRVALKVLPLAAALNPKQLQRFKNEAQAAAQLRHANIVPVYAVGCERGVHYYAMQYIEGQSLAAVINELRKGSQPGSTQNQATVSATHIENRGNETGQGDKETRRQVERETGRQSAPSQKASASSSHADAERFRRAAQLRTAAVALEHAHQTGVVHRDIKPANLLLDGYGNLWITDFGLALVRGDANLTLSGELVGTVRYMSPEQASGRPGLIDHRTDVYSLGVTLYELLTLQPLIAGDDRQRLLQAVLMEEPIAPRQLECSIPPELETIVLKATAKTPSDRYATAQEFADDLGRFLEDRPILAKRPSLIDRVRKWSRRHRSLVASATVVLILAALGLIVSTVLLAEEAAETRKAYEQKAQQAAETRKAYEQKAQQAEEARLANIRANRNLDKARHAVDFFSDAVNEQLTKSTMHQGVRRLLLERALDYYQDLLDQAHADPLQKEELIRSRAKVEGIVSELVLLEGPIKLQLLQQSPVRAALNLTPDQVNDLEELAVRVAPIVRDLTMPGEPEPVKRPLAASTVGLLATPFSQGPLLASFVLYPGRKLNKFEGDKEPRKGPIDKKPRKEALDVDELSNLLIELEERLTKEQYARLGQLRLQMKARGLPGFAHPEVSAVLGLTPDQRERFRNLSDPGMKPPPSMRKTDEIYEKSLALLTAEQSQRWRELAGPSVHGLAYIQSVDSEGPGWPSPGSKGKGDKGKGGKGKGDKGKGFDKGKGGF